MFQTYLTSDQIRELVTSAVQDGLVDVSRSLLLQSIPRSFVLGLHNDPTPLGQFQLDLARFNRTERLASGEIPLEIFLDNLAFQAGLAASPNVPTYAKFSTLVRHRACGITGLPALASLPEIVSNEAIVGVNDMLGFEFFSQALATGASVARLQVPRFENGVPTKDPQGKPWIMLGTGWLIAPDLLLTNHHVLNARRSEEPAASPADLASQASETIVEFDFEFGKNPLPIRTAGLLASDPALDYALLSLQPGSNRPTLPIARSPLTFTAASYLSVNIIQHPRGQSKQVAIRNNLVSGADATLLRYFTDTDFGSSGSPVCSDSWRVLALHRGAQFSPDASYQGKPAAYVNFGTQIAPILTDIAGKSPPAHAAILAANP
jgi:endonuclease G, mitochondrial